MYFKMSFEYLKIMEKSTKIILQVPLFFLMQGKVHESWWWANALSSVTSNDRNTKYIYISM